MTDEVPPNPSGEVATPGHRSHRSPAHLGSLRTRISTPQSFGFVAYLVVHVLIVIGLPTPEFPDSPHYFTFSVTGGGSEPPTVPLFYSIARTDPGRIGLQAVVAALAWWCLASVIATRVTDRRVRLGVQLVLLALGVVGPVANWNTTILSESLSISLTALLIAAWFRYVESPNRIRLALLILCSLLWADSRQAHIYLSLLIVAATAVVMVFRRRRDVLGWVLLVALVLISGSGLMIVDSNHYVGGGIIADTVEDRILPNASYTSWFVNAGMPYDAAIAATANGAFGQALGAIPQWEAWNDANGTRTYLQFIVTHPRYTLWEPLASFLGEQPSLEAQTPALYAATDPDPTTSMLSPDAIYGRHRNVLPGPISDLLFDPGQVGDVLLLAAIAGWAALAARRRRGPDRRLIVPIVVALSTIPHGYFVDLLSGVGEQDRLSIVLAVALRIALWSILAFSVDRLLLPQASDPAHPVTRSPVTNASSGDSSLGQ